MMGGKNAWGAEKTHGERKKLKGSVKECKSTDKL